MPVLKNDAMKKVLDAINLHQFDRWKTYAHTKTEAAGIKGEVAVLGSLFWELSTLMHDTDMDEIGANKEVYAKFTDIIAKGYSADAGYGYRGELRTPEQQAEKDGHRIGVEWAEKALAEVVLAP